MTGFSAPVLFFFCPSGKLDLVHRKGVVIRFPAFVVQVMAVVVVVAAAVEEEEEEEVVVVVKADDLAAAVAARVNFH